MGGFFPLAKTIVVDGDGKETGVFEFDRPLVKCPCGELLELSDMTSNTCICGRSWNGKAEKVAEWMVA